MGFLAFTDNLVVREKCTEILTPDVRHTPAPRPRVLHPPTRYKAYSAREGGGQRTSPTPRLGPTSGPFSPVGKHFITCLQVRRFYSSRVQAEQKGGRKRVNNNRGKELYKKWQSPRVNK